MQAFASRGKRPAACQSLQDRSLTTDGSGEAAIMVRGSYGTKVSNLYFVQLVMCVEKLDYGAHSIAACVTIFYI